MMAMGGEFASGLGGSGRTTCSIFANKKSSQLET